MAIVKSAGVQCYLESTKTRNSLKEHETRKTAARCTNRKNVQYAGISSEGEFDIVILLDSFFPWDAYNALSVELHFDSGSVVKNQITIPRSMGREKVRSCGRNQTVFRISYVETPVEGYQIERSKFAFKRRISNENSSKAPEDIEHLGQIWLDISRVLVKDEVRTIRQTILDRDTKNPVSDTDLGPSSRGLDYSIQLNAEIQTKKAPTPQSRAVHVDNVAKFLFLYRCSDFLENIPDDERIDDTPTAPRQPKRGKMNRSSTASNNSTVLFQNLKDTEASPEVHQIHRSPNPISQTPPLNIVQQEPPTLAAQIQDADVQIQAQKERKAVLLIEKEGLLAQIRLARGQRNLKRKHEELAAEREKIAALENEIGSLRAELDQLNQEG